MSDKHELQGGHTAFQAAANSPPENQEDEARPLPSNGYSRRGFCGLHTDLAQVLHTFKSRASKRIITSLHSHQ